MTVINTNTASINAQFNLNKVNQEMEKAMEQLSSGRRINSAGDDAAGLSIATRMESQVRGLQQAIRNAGDGQSMVNTAEGAMGEMTSMLQRMRELSIQAANGSNTDTDRAALNSEVDQLKLEMDRIVSTTTFNSKSLLDGGFNTSLQVGVNAGEKLSFTVANMGTSSLGAISGVVDAAAVTSATYTGVEAKPTKTQLHFNGSDSFSFKLELGLGNNNSNDVFNINADVTGNLNTDDVVSKINAALRDTENGAPDNAARSIIVSNQGNVVTIENLTGGAVQMGKINDSTQLSAAGSTIGFSTVTMDDAGNSDNLILGSNANVKVAFTNAGGDAGDAFAGVKEIQKISITDALAVKLTGTTAQLNVGDVTLTADLSGDSTTENVVAAFVAATGYDATKFTITTSGDDLVISHQEAGVKNLATLSNAYADVASTVTTAGAAPSTAGVNQVTTITGITMSDDTYYIGDGTTVLSADFEAGDNLDNIISKFEAHADFETFKMNLSRDGDNLIATAKVASTGAITISTDKGTTDEIQAVAVADINTDASKTYAIGNGTNTISVTLDASGGADAQAKTQLIVDAFDDAASATLNAMGLTLSTNAAGDLLATFNTGVNEGDLVLSGDGFDNTAPSSTTTAGGAKVDHGTATNTTTGVAEAGGDKQVLSVSVPSATIAEIKGEAATLKVGNVELTADFSAGAPADLAALVAAFQADAGYEEADFLITAGTNAITITSKEKGVQTVTSATLANQFVEPSATASTEGVDAVDASDAEDGSLMFLSLSGPDTYELGFKSIDNTIATSVRFTHDGSSSNLSNIASVIESALMAGDKFGAGATYDIEVTTVDGRIKINDLNGNGFKISSFSSDGAGTITAANWLGQSSGGPGSVILDDTEYATSATTIAAGVAKSTDVKMKFIGDDNYSFRISDGTATAHIENIGTGTKSAAGGTSEMLANVKDALQRAGLSSVITASDSNGEIVLSHSEGRNINITNFQSSGEGVVQVGANTTFTTGYSAFLDDGAGKGEQSRIADIHITDINSATNAIAIIDRALEDITAQRAGLGAISNRLDHTISNLGSIVINTEAAQSRIEDADFAKVTGDLTKSQIMSQAATAMLAQANASKQGVLSLLQG
ncbi:flagellin [Planktomarina temperata]|nr:flagellin [Planktomarina temperata]